jgi:hypothetical protein
MISYLRSSVQAQPQDVKTKLIRIYAALLAFNIFPWSWSIFVFHGNSVLCGAAFLAYSFGLRHAVDADHIAAIDNVTRTLMQEGDQPVTIGLMCQLRRIVRKTGLNKQFRRPLLFKRIPEPSFRMWLPRRILLKNFHVE